MVLTASTMLPLGSVAPSFSLPNVVDDSTVSLHDLADSSALVVIFLCNHCPYVKHIADTLAKVTREYQAKGAAVVGISSNDITTHPNDGPEQMKEEAIRRGYTFPYLFDGTQAVAKAYRAACTPDFFLFNQAQQLVYRGQFDASRPGNGIPVTGADLTAAIDAVLAGQSPTPQQTPSMGCNIKWIAGNEPDYFK